jgi:hypothetical protein
MRNKPKKGLSFGTFVKASRFLMSSGNASSALTSFFNLHLLAPYSLVVVPRLAPENPQLSGLIGGVVSTSYPQ